MVQIKHFTELQKKASFSTFKTSKLAVAGQNTPPILVINSLDKAFHFPKFQAKLFFTE